MNLSDRFSKPDQILKANYSIARLTQEKSDILKVNEGLYKVFTDDIINGDLGDNIKTHLLSLIDLNTSFTSLLQMDIQSNIDLIDILDRLITDTEDEVLDGDIVLYMKQKYADLEYQAKCDIVRLEYELSTCKSSEDIFGYGLAIAHAESERDRYCQLREKYQRQENLFDAIEFNTSSLFQGKDDLRKTIQDGYTYLPSEWNGNTCNPQVVYAWKSNLCTIKESFIQQYADVLYSTNQDGSISIKWDIVNNWFDSDPNSLNTYQYLALASLYSKASLEDMSQIFLSTSRGAHNGTNIIDDTFGNSLLYYKYSSMFSGDYNHLINNNDLLRATSMITAYNYVNSVKNDHEDYTVIFSNTPLADDNSIIESYNISIKCTPSDSQIQLESINRPPVSVGWGPDIIRSGKDIEFNIRRYAIGASLTYESNQIVTAYINDLGGNWTDYNLSSLGHFMFGSISSIPFAKDIPLIYSSTSLMAYAYDTYKQEDALRSSSAAIDTLCINQMFSVVCGGANVISGDYNMWATGKENVVSFANVTIDEEELRQRITLYNDDPNNSIKITYDGVVKNFFRAINGETDPKSFDLTEPLNETDYFVLLYRWYYTNN